MLYKYISQQGEIWKNGTFALLNLSLKVHFTVFSKTKDVDYFKEILIWKIKQRANDDLDFYAFELLALWKLSLIAT